MSRTDARLAIRAARKERRGVVVCETTDQPNLAPDEVLVRITRASICGSDLHSVDQEVGPWGSGEHAHALGFPGHEAVGIIEDSRTDSFTVGQRVLVLQPGSFADYVAVSAGQCLLLPDDVPDETAILAQPLGVALYAMKRYLRVLGDDRRCATVIGCGSIGNIFVQLCAKSGFKSVIASDFDEARLQRAVAAGATDVVRAGRTSGEGVVGLTDRLTNGMGSTLVIEAAGHDLARLQAAACVGQYGCLGLFGYPERNDDSPFPYAAIFWKAPITIEVVARAQQEAGLESFARAVEMIRSGEFDTSVIDVLAFPLEEIGAAFEAARQHRALKCQLVMTRN